MEDKKSRSRKERRGMKKSKVYYTDARSLQYRHDFSLPAKYKRLLEAGNFKSYIPSGKKVAVKIHFGTSGAFRIIRPPFLRITVEEIKAARGIPFITDTGGLSKLEAAVQNGITELSVGAPVIVAGGIDDTDAVMVKTGGALLGEIGVAGAIYDADVMVVVSHAKGHIQSGFGGALKNVAMGCVATQNRAGENQRGRMHAKSEAPFQWDEKLCTLCGQCVEVCSYTAKAVSMKDKKVIIDTNRCWRCGRCVRVCPTGALSVDLDDKTFSTGLAESCKAVLSTFEAQHVAFVNVILEFQPECDCMSMADTPIIQDQGILFSDDPVAIDAATLDLCAKTRPLPQSRAEDQGIGEAGPDMLKKVIGPDPWVPIRVAEEMGLGTTKYEIIPIEPGKQSKRS